MPKLTIRLSTNTPETQNILVKLDILDSSLKKLAGELIPINTNREFNLPVGIYGVRAFAPSGQVVEKVVTLVEDTDEYCEIDLHQVSPHEDQAWAYLSQPIDQPGNQTFSDPKYEGAWIRLWKRDSGNVWNAIPFPTGFMKMERKEDSVSYSFISLDDNFYALQVGGTNIPWKIFALPSTYVVHILIRPSSQLSKQAYPLDVIVASDKWQVESLLSLMQRGEISQAADFVNETELAQDFLSGKVTDSNAAAVGGYFLLRVGQNEINSQWIQSLDEYFQYLPDGAIIHAWLHLQKIREDPALEEKYLQEIRTCLLDAVHRGFPLYTEGLRLLRDGLLLLNQRKRNLDEEILEALKSVGKFSDAADWSCANTSFTGNDPNSPTTNPKKGIPADRNMVYYLFDVPLKDAIDAGVVKPGDSLVVKINNTDIKSLVNDDGKIELEDGRKFKSIGAAQQALTGSATKAWDSWKLGSSRTSLQKAVKRIRKGF